MGNGPHQVGVAAHVGFNEKRFATPGFGFGHYGAASLGIAAQADNAGSFAAQAHGRSPADAGSSSRDETDFVRRNIAGENRSV